MAPQFGTDGVRGLANQEITPEVAVALGRATIEVLSGSEPHLVIGRDTRRSGWMIQAGLVAGATAAGATVELLGEVPTPAVSWAAADRDVPGAMISASHNPFGDNGIKLFAAGGSKLSDSEEMRVQQRYLELLGRRNLVGPTVAAVGTLVASEGVDGWTEAILDSLESKLDFNMVVDCANGSASVIGPEIFRKLGAHVVEIGTQPDGININDGYGSTSTARLQQAVSEQQADVGIAFDGDADRLIAVDHYGEIVDGDRVIAILAADWKARNILNGNTVVVTVMSNLGFHLAMKNADIEVVTTKVGDRHVLEELDRGGFSLGGEQSGHIICRDIAPTGDGILSAVQLLAAVQRTSKSLAVLAADAMQSVPQVLKNVQLPDMKVDIVGRLADPIAKLEAMFGSDGRILVRTSGTEPLLRVMVEHLDAAVARKTCDGLVETAQKAMGSGPT